MQKVTVIGGGMVGVSCALALQEKGYQVTLIEKNDFGQETSFGNAGVISRSSIIPLNNPGLWQNLPKYMSNRHPALRYSLGYLLKHLPWLTGFLRRATPSQARETIQALDQLIAPSLALHQRWIQAAGVEHRLRDTGWLKLYRHTRSFSNSHYERDYLTRHQVQFRCLDAAEIQSLEPALKPVFQHGIFVTETASVDNPGAVTAAYGQLFLQRGGQHIRDYIRRIHPINPSESSEQGSVRQNDGHSSNVPARYLLKGEQGDYSCEQLVLATGPWGNELLSPLGQSIPLCYERGYHQHFNLQQPQTLKRPCYDVDASYVMTPTDLGLRISSGSELTGQHARHNPAQLHQVLPAVKEAIELGDAEALPPWLGSRPSTPDSLPVIGELPDYPGIWLAMGHQHIGFSTGPVTGHLIASALSGQTVLPELMQPIDAQCFSVQRFR